MGKLFVTVFTFAPAPKANLYWFLHLVPKFILLDGFRPLLPAIGKVVQVMQVLQVMQDLQ